MSGWLLGSLEALGLAAVAATLVSLLSILILPLTAKIRSAARRADAVFLLGLTPLTIAAALCFAVMLPAVLEATGIRSDHCDLHLHHPHLCALHAGGAHTPLVAVGALALLVGAWRAARLAIVQLQANRTLAALERLGRTEHSAPFPVVNVPGSPWVCLAAGGLRRRVLLSATIADHLGPRQVQAALAHEVAHLQRQDPLLSVALAWAGLAALPAATERVRVAFAEAAEQASDAAAARDLGAVVVAESLVAMARLSRTTVPATCMAFGGTSLEQRVHALLHGPLDSNPARSAPVALALAAASAVSAVLGSDPIHHLVESLLQIFG
jgi:Zn-dependent protease with chaperone function